LPLEPDTREGQPGPLGVTEQSAEEALAVLRGIVGREVFGLRRKPHEHQRRAALNDARDRDALAFDETLPGNRLRRLVYGSRRWVSVFAKRTKP
jgi:hypothetical protein